MNNISIAKETIQVTSEKKYVLSGKTICLPDIDYKNVIVYSPAECAELLNWDISEAFQDKPCSISVVNEDSFQAAGRFDRPFVMNFANAHHAGGGFMMGANAQEEALCRCSTLYASISSEKASKMYNYNNTHISRVESDHMLLSPDVCVFRNEKYEFLREPFMASVFTVPAPNRHGAAMFASQKMVSEIMIRRIKIMLRIAAKNGYKNLILGAWGCGAFGNKPENVSQYFKSVLIDEKYGQYFDEVCFAIFGKPDGKNINAFRKTFSCLE